MHVTVTCCYLICPALPQAIDYLPVKYLYVYYHKDFVIDADEIEKRVIWLTHFRFHAKF